MFNEPQILPSMVANSGITTHYTPNCVPPGLHRVPAGLAAALALVMAVITIAIAYAVQIRGLRNALDR